MEKIEVKGVSIKWIRKYMSSYFIAADLLTYFIVANLVGKGGSV